MGGEHLRYLAIMLQILVWAVADGVMPETRDRYSLERAGGSQLIDSEWPASSETAIAVTLAIGAAHRQPGRVLDGDGRGSLIMAGIIARG